LYGSAIGEKNCRRGWKFFEIFLFGFEQSRVVGQNWETVFGNVRGGQYQIAQGFSAVIFHGELKGGHFAGHAAGERTRLAQVRIPFAVAHKHVVRGGGGRHFTPVNTDVFAIRKMDEQEAAAADAGVVRVHDAERKTDRDGGINRIAAGLERVHAGLRGERIHGRNHAVR
jgi:hypothetical protein